MEEQKLLRLQEILEEQLSIQDRVGLSAQLMRDAISSRNLISIKRIISDFDNLTANMDSLERERLKITSEETDIKLVRPRLTQLYPFIDNDKKEKLERLRTNLRTKMKDNMRKNSGNVMLLEESLMNIDKNVSVLAHGVGEVDRYKYNGKAVEGLPKQFLNEVG